MRYALLIYGPEPATQPDEAETAKEMAAYGGFTQEIKDRGLMEGGEALEQTRTATTVRVKDGQTLVTDGPFAETKEALGGFYLIKCRDLDEAIEIAAKIPGAKRGSIEIRPVWELPPDYAQQAQGSGAQAATSRA
jgi:hypothetical protein